MKVSLRRRMAALTVALLFIMTGCAKNEVTLESGGDSQSDRSLVIGYAEEGVTVVHDEDEFASAIQQAIENAENSAVALEYQNEAYSRDGVNFSCYVANSVNNLYDMFIQIFADETYQDELFLSQLLRPGQAFETLKLNHSLPTGTTRVYVAMTQVDTADDGEQTLMTQTFVTMDFIVY
jgi:hypothetical protein